MSKWSQQEAHPWRCVCGKLNRKKDNFCPDCQASWKTGTPEPVRHPDNAWANDPRYAWTEYPNTPWNAQDAWSQPSSRRPSQSPRAQRPPKPPKSGKGKQKGKGKGKGKAKDGGKTPPQTNAGPPGPLQIDASSPSPWLLPAPDPTAAPPWATSAATASGGETEKQLRQLITTLQKEEGLSAQAQEALQQITIKTEQDDTRLMHSAVARLGNARKHLASAVGSRHQLHAAWAKFLQTSIAQWQQWTEDFGKQDKEALDKINLAKQSLAAAKEQFAGNRGNLGLKTEPVDLASSDDEDGKSNKGAQLAVDMEGVAVTLQGLKSKADEMVAEDQQEAKRCKTATPAQGAAATAQTVPAAVASSPSCVPFGTASR